MEIAAPFVEAVFSLFLQKVGVFWKETSSSSSVEEMIEDMSRKFREISVVVRSAENRAFHEEGVKMWLSDFRALLYDMEDIVDDITIQEERCREHWLRSRLPKKICNMNFQKKIRKQIEEINSKLSGIKRRKEELKLKELEEFQRRASSITRIMGSGTEKTTLMGEKIKMDKEYLIKMITGGDHLGKNQNVPTIISIIGSAGIGKTTLAQSIYNDMAVKRNFEKTIWACVSKDFNEIDLLEKILHGAMVNSGDRKHKEFLLNGIYEALSGRKIFLVLDDVWDWRVWEELLKNYLATLAKGSIVLITTRQTSISLSMGATHAHQMELLSIDDAWLLLWDNVSVDGSDKKEIGGLRDVGIQIVEKCGRLPLAIKAIAGVLRRIPKSNNDWKRKILQNNVWQLDHTHNDVMAAIYLSYEDLPSTLKQCFIYCSLFLKNAELEKHIVALYLIAEGFLQEEAGDRPISERAKAAFEQLVDRNLLQKDPEDYEGYKMHDLLRNFGQEVGKAENYCGEERSKDNSSICRVLTSTKEEILNYDRRVYHRRLRTLSICRSPQMTGVSKNFFNNIGHLRVLDLSGTKIKNVPDSIGNLVHLRLLDLRETPIIALPESLASLRNLVALILAGCESLSSLPKGTSKLQKLIYLDIGSTKISSMPKGMKQLKQLERLDWIVEETMNGKSAVGSSIEDLGSFEFLTFLMIVGVERIEAAKGASMAGLRRKAHLNHLVLICLPPSPVLERDMENVKNVLDELQPPLCLEQLALLGFFGGEYPKWLSSPATSGYDNLRLLCLGNLVCCEELPQLGQLPQLVVCVIIGSPGIQRINMDFFVGRERLEGNEQPFPKLELLSLKDMPNLVECSWDGVKVDVAGDQSRRQLAPFPLLQELLFENCPKLKSLWKCLGHATSLTLLQVNNMSSLEDLPDLPALKRLEVIECPSLKRTGHFDALESILLEGETMDALPSWVGRLATATSPSAPSIQELYIISGRINMIRRLDPWRIGFDWPAISNVPLVQAGGISDEWFPFEYTRSPFLLDDGSGGGIYSDHPHFMKNGTSLSDARHSASNPAGPFPDEIIPEENMHCDKYLKLPLNFHVHREIKRPDGTVRTICHDQSYFDETGFIVDTGSHRHLPYTTAGGEPGISCYYHPCLSTLKGTKYN